MLIETKPNIKVVKLDNITAEISFEIPEKHAVIAAYVKNNGTATRSFQANPGGFPVFSGSLVQDQWISASLSRVLFDSVVEPDISVQDGFADVDLDILIVLMDLSV